MSTAPVHSIMHVHIYLQDVCLMSLWLVASVHLLFQTQATIETQAPLRLAWAGHFYSATEDGSRSFSEVRKMGIRSEWDKAFCWQSVMFPSLPRTIQSQKYNWNTYKSTEECVSRLGKRPCFLKEVGAAEQWMVHLMRMTLLSQPLRAQH